MRTLLPLLVLLLTATAVQAGLEEREANTREALSQLLGCCGALLFACLLFFGTLVTVRRWWNRREDRRDDRNPWTPE